MFGNFGVPSIVKNISKDDALFEIYPDNMEQVFDIDPNTFLLEGGQSREITLGVHTTHMALVQTNISIVSRPLEKEELIFGSGIKIPVTVYSHDAQNRRPPASLGFITPITKILLWILGALAVLLVMVIISKKIRK